VIALPTTPGGWGCLAADPPWSFHDKGSRAAPDWRLRDAGGYRTMRAEQVLTLPVAAIVAPQAHLYLWVTDAHLLDGTAALVCRAWGFRPKQLLDWVKVGRTGKLQVGLGHYFRHTSEHVIFATRGRAPALRHDLVATFMAPRTAHSVKPDRLQELAELMSPSPRLELFARRARPGWTAWGDEAPAERAA
jgi:N6-adenosine-specific RNA methylase IME4